AGELCAMSPSLPFPNRSPGCAAGSSNGPRLASLRSLRHDLTDEVAGFLFYSLADLEAPEALHLRLVLREHVAHAQLVRLVLHEHLAGQRDVVDELAELALDHLRDDLRRLLLLRSLGHDDLALLGEHVLWDVVG